MKERYFHFLTATSERGSEWDVVLIAEGWSANDVYYPVEVLEEARGLFEGVQISAYEFDGKLYDHVPDEVRRKAGPGLVRNIVGWVSDVHCGEIPGDRIKGLLGKFHVAGSAEWLRLLLADAFEHGLKHFLGFSIDAQGEIVPGIRQGRQGAIAKSINLVDEVTIVSHPAAGGKFQRMVASATMKSHHRKGANMQWKFLEALLEVVRRADPGLLEARETSCLTEADAVSMIRQVAGELEEDKLSTTHLKATLRDLLEMIEEGKRKRAVEILETLLGEDKGKVEDDEDEEEAKKREQDDEEAKKQKNEDEDDDKKRRKYGEIRESLTRLREAEEKAIAAAKRLERSEKLANCRASLRESLNQSKFPQAIRNKIDRYFTDKIFTPEELSTFMKAEEEALAALFRESGLPQGAGLTGSLQIGDHTQAEFSAAMLGLLTGRNEPVISDGGKEGRKVRAFRSLKEAFRHVANEFGEINPQDVLFEAFWFTPTFIRESDDWEREVDNRVFRSWRKFKESITTSSFGEILGDSITRAMIRAYAESDLQVWRNIVSEITPISDFRTQRRMRMGGYGVLPTIAQQGTYEELTSPTDEEVTYSVAKRGGLESLTIEAIANDDVQALRRIPKELALAANLTLYRQIFDRFVANADGIATPEMGNLGSTTLTPAEMDAVRQNMRQMTAYGNSYRQLGINNVPRWLLVPPELENIAYKLSTSPTRVNPLATLETNSELASTNPNIHADAGKGKLDYLVVDYWTDANDWWAVANPARIPTIEVGFYQGRQEPELFIADQVNMGSMFSADKIAYKIRFIFGSVTLDPRAFYGEIV